MSEKEIKEYLSRIGREGGKGGKGQSKLRGDSNYYKHISMLAAKARRANAAKRHRTKKTK